MKDLLVRQIKEARTSTNGTRARLVLETHDGETYALVFPTSHLDIAAETLVELCSSLKITGALAERNASNELTMAPDLHRIREVVGLYVPENDTSIFDLELKTQQGLTLQLCFDSGQLQRLARTVLKIDQPEEIAGEH